LLLFFSPIRVIWQTVVFFFRSFSLVCVLVVHSSKIFAMANAAGHLRVNETHCIEGTFGLQDSVQGKHGTTPLGDLATVVCSYDTTAGYSSNSLSSYFHDIGWRGRVDDLVVNWLGASGQSLGGNYGEATPSDLSFAVNDEVSRFF
jgi:hypothetical protein